MSTEIPNPETGLGMHFRSGRRDYKLEWRDDQWMLWLKRDTALSPLGTVRQTETGWRFRSLRGHQRDTFERPTFDRLMEFAL